MANPRAIKRLHRALAFLPGVSDVSSGIQDLEGWTGDYLGLPHFIPHGALRRTNGGLPAEALIQIEFRLEQSPAGWRSLEFIAWFVSDQARGGRFIQLRPFALPPMVDEQVQLGATLKWYIELFCPDTGEDLSPQLTEVDSIASGLESCVRMYPMVLGEPRPSRSRRKRPRQRPD